MKVVPREKPVLLCEDGLFVLCGQGRFDVEIRDAAELRTRGSLGGEKATVTRLHPIRQADGLIAVDLWVLEPGGKFDAHKHGEEHVIFVLAGAIEVSGGGASSSVVREGGVVSIEGGETHGLRNRGNEAA